MSYTQFLPSMPLVEPIIVGMASLLATSLPAVIVEANGNITDGFTVPTVAQYLDHFPAEHELEGGLPIVAVGETSEAGGVFVDDLQSSVDSELMYAVGMIHQEADQETLVKSLRRLQVCVAYTIQQDRLLGSASYMRQTAGVFSVNFLRTEAGPMVPMGPMSANQPPHAWLTWSSFIMSSRHNEQL
jgi:hypothetical protein